MSTLLHDLRCALRTFGKSPGFTAVVVVTLALGIGANTAIFSVVSAVVLRPLPFDEPDQLVMVLETERGDEFTPGFASYPNFLDWRGENHVFEEMAVSRPAGYTLTGTGQPERIHGARVSAGFFSMLRVEAALGRAFLPQDDEDGAENVALVSHGLWQRRFGGDQSLLGQTLTLNGTAFTVVGILPPDFSFPLEISAAELWTPSAFDAGFFLNRGAHLLRTAARLRPDVTLNEAQAEMDTIASQLEQQYPDTNAERGVNLVPLHEQVVGNARPALLVLLAAVGLVLLIACANVANLLLARSSGRRRELAVRAALGAGRGRLIRQLLTESVLLGLIGGVGGLLLAFWGIDALVAVIPTDIPRLDQIGLDVSVLGFTLAVSILTGLVFGLAPAFHASRFDLHESLKEGGRPSATVGRHRLRGFLVVSEVALALVLLVGAGLLMRSFQRLMDVNPGFDTDSVLTFRMSVPFSQYSDPDKRADLYRQILERIGALPGVQSAGATTTLPLEPSRVELSFEVQSRPQPPPGQEPVVRYSSISADYFHTLGIPLRKGRLFTKQDTRDKPGVAIINETMARRHWPNEDPIGQRIAPSAVMGDDDPEYFEIVGIVADVRSRGLDIAADPCMYFPFRQQTWPFMSFALRTGLEPTSLVAAVRGEVAAVTKDEAASGFRTMEEYLAKSAGARQFPMLLVGIFAAVALLLAAVGIYGMLSYSVAQRTHEIGVRVALGACKSDVLRLVLKRCLTLTVVGIVIGLLLSAPVGLAIQSQLFGVSRIDPAAYVSVSVLLLAVAALAGYLPARRATKVDPMVALRCE